MSGMRFTELETRPRASPEQFAALLEFMETHGDLARPQQGAQGRLKADRLWQELNSLLNATGGGVIKSIEKWKKVWADWKAKTKKKALLRQREVSGTGGGPRSKLPMNAFEQRVLGIMGVNAVVGNSMIEEAGFDEPLTNRMPPTSIPTEFHSQNSVGNNKILDLLPFFTDGNLELSSILPPSSFQNIIVSAPPPQVPTPPPRVPTPPPQVPTPPPRVSTPPPLTPFPSSPIRRPPPRRRRYLPSPSLAASPTASTPRRRRLRRVQTPFERATDKFVGVENRRLQLEETRERNRMQLEVEREENFHKREMERLRLESRRLDLEALQMQRSNQMETMLTEILTQLRSLSQP